jgi:hypothetical protein
MTERRVTTNSAKKHPRISREFEKIGFLRKRPFSPIGHKVEKIVELNGRRPIDEARMKTPSFGTGVPSKTKFLQRME